MPIQLNNQQKKYLRNLGHALKPMVMIGEQGLTESVVAELDQTLGHHELIKVRISVGDRDARDALIKKISKRLDITVAQQIGNIAVCYRPRPANFKAGKATRLETIKLPTGSTD
ncbi:MAG: RNA-binding protein [Gammaproteobacteria bacterium]|jgi:RNA-binding protein